MDDVKQQEMGIAKRSRGDNHVGRHASIWKKLLIIVLIVAVISGGVALWSLINSTNAVNDYVGAVDEQYKEIVAGENIDQPNVKLREVAFGDVVNSKYRKVKELEPTYIELINKLRNYTQTMDVHNQLVEKFNTGIGGEMSLDSDILGLVDQLGGMIRNNYPEQTKAIADVDELYQLVATSTSFDEISSQMNKVLYDNDKWLGEEREAIEVARADFQQTINSL